MPSMSFKTRCLPWTIWESSESMLQYSLKQTLLSKIILRTSPFDKQSICLKYHPCREESWVKSSPHSCQIGSPSLMGLPMLWYSTAKMATSMFCQGGSWRSWHKGTVASPGLLGAGTAQLLVQTSRCGRRERIQRKPPSLCLQPSQAWTALLPAQFHSYAVFYPLSPCPGQSPHFSMRK